MSFFISDAVASTGAAPAGGGMELIFMLAIFGVVFYFMVFRPQSKRQKEQKKLMESLSKGDEVLTAGGIVGKIAKVSDDAEMLVLTLDENTNITIKKDYVVAMLPKGTIKSL